MGAAGHAQPEFEPSQAVCSAGVLFLLPSLLSQGLLKTKEVYQLPPTHYYGLESIVLTLAFMALARIKNPEQLKQCKPGEIGKIIGLDRVPEVSCLREKVKLLSNQFQAQKLNRLLIEQWYQQPEEESHFLYIDGHVRIYYGAQANLPSKFVSRQKLCLSATTEYWVNDAQGQPVMMVMGELTEKLQHAIEDQIIPQLKETTLLGRVQEQNPVQALAPPPQALEVPATKPVCTLIFDREAYEVPFFRRLWEEHQIAIITYRKNVKDVWKEDEFENKHVMVLNQGITMQLCEKETELSGVKFREIRRLNVNGHQTSIITNNTLIETETAAGRMFGRWSQENFFRYLIMDFDFDKMIEFGTESIDPDKEVVNPEYRKANQRLKKEREKLQRLKAKLYPLAEQSMEESLDQQPALSFKQIEIVEKISNFQSNIKQIINEREKILPRIKLSQMKYQQRYNKLKPESKMFMNIIKMICYRAESSIVNLLDDVFSNEKRMLVKQIIGANADIIPDEKAKTLTIVLHSLSAPRFNRAAEKLALLLNQTETVFPGTDLTLIFKTTAFSNCDR
jgi:hypothetical protein